MSRDIDRTKSLGEADEHDLLIALGDIWGERGKRHLTRSEEVEIRHVALYEKQRLEELRTEVLRPDHKAEHVRLELAQVVANLLALDKYLDGKGYATSAMGDRNRR